MRHRGRAALRQADADRLQDHHRLRRADQAGQGLDARRAAGRRGDQGRAREARLAACRPSRCRPTCSRPGARRARAAARSARPGSSAAAKLDARKRAMLGDPIDGRRSPRRLRRRSAEIKAEFAAAPPKIATRVASQKVLEKLVPALPCLIGGSADLTGSNGTRTKQHASVAPERLRAATTSTTACASMPWRRP